jgi:Rrf2 family protein
MIFVAAINGQRTCSINEISESENIPREYLAKILKELSQKGFLRSYKGVNGGYKLAKPRDQISYLDILVAMQGPFAISSCNMEDREASGCRGKDKCATFAFWDDLQKKLMKILGDMTLGKIDYNKFYPQFKAGKA